MHNLQRSTIEAIQLRLDNKKEIEQIYAKYIKNFNSILNEEIITYNTLNLINNLNSVMAYTNMYEAFYSIFNILETFTVYEGNFYYLKCQKPKEIDIQELPKYYFQVTTKQQSCNFIYCVHELLKNKFAILDTLPKLKDKINSIFLENYTSEFIKEICSYYKKNCKFIDLLMPFLLEYGFVIPENINSYCIIDNTVFILKYNVSNILLRIPITPENLEIYFDVSLSQKYIKLFSEIFCNSKNLFPKLKISIKDELNILKLIFRENYRFPFNSISYNISYNKKTKHLKLKENPSEEDKFILYNFHLKYLNKEKNNLKEYFITILKILTNNSIKTLNSLCLIFYTYCLKTDKVSTYFIKSHQSLNDVISDFFCTFFVNPIISITPNDIISKDEKNFNFLLFNRANCYKSSFFMKSYDDSIKNNSPKLATFLRGDEICCNSKIQPLTYKNAFDFILLYDNNENVSDLKNRLLESNIAITDIKLSNDIDIDLLKKLLKNFFYNNNYYFYFLLVIIGYISSFKLKNRKKLSPDKAMTDFIQSFCTVSKSEKDITYAKDLFNNFNIYTNNIYSFNTQKEFYEKIKKHYNDNGFSDVTIKDSIHTIDEKGNDKNAKAFLYLKFDNTKFKKSIEEKSEQKNNLNLENTEEEFNNYLSDIINEADSMIEELKYKN